MEAATNTGALPDEEAEAPRAGFEINGEWYEIPTLDTINLDEERILYVYADTVLQDLARANPNASEEDQLLYSTVQLRRIRNPDFKRGLAHIAYRRVHPEVSDGDIQNAIGFLNAQDLDLALLHGDEVAEDPTKGFQTSLLSASGENESSSQTKPTSELTKPGSDTENASGLRVVTPSPTGTSGSGTSSESLPEIVA